jgi:hypothetical protein
MDYGAGWGNRRNRGGTAPPVLNFHPWGRNTVPDHHFIASAALNVVDIYISLMANDERTESFWSSKLCADAHICVPRMVRDFGEEF